MVSFKRTLLTLGWIVVAGCATWKPSGDQPPPISGGLQATPISNDTVAIEAIILRLGPEQSPRLTELWSQADEQILSPTQRLLLDSNGIRAGKLSIVPHVLETWIRETGERQSQDTMEQAGLTADVKSMSYHLRCRANNIKEISLRELGEDRVTLFYTADGLKGRHLSRPRFFFKLAASPDEQGGAKLRLTPEIEHGELKSKVVVREAALRNISEREFMSFPDFDIQSKLQRGEILVVGPTPDRKGIGAEFLHSLTQERKYEPVLLLLRVAQSGADNTFAPIDAKKSNSPSLQ
jgi:hypothetical protein